jgi:hypothetical protein
MMVDGIIRLIDDAMRKLAEFPTKPAGLLQAA